MAGFQAWVRGLLARKGERRRDTPSSEPPTRPDGVRPFAEGHNDFALALYGRLLQWPGNLFFSPFSIRAALGMAHAGARGETAAQMSRTLRFASSGETLHVASGEIVRRLGAAGGGEHRMGVANSLWAQDGAPLRAEFVDMVVRHYGGDVGVVDFRRDAEAARSTINRYVEDKTGGHIRDLLPPGGLDARLVLVNAVYFKGRWALRFSKVATRDEPFYLEGGGRVRAPLMHQHEELRYLQADGFQAVELDYRGGELSMLILLPDKRDGLRDLETRLSARMLRDRAVGMRVREVEVFLPRFRMRWGGELEAGLRALGMPLAFTPFRADFSGINGREPPDAESLFISAVLHQAFVDVDEEGTEAAAATAVMPVAAAARWRHRPPPVPIVRADHPFLFAIRDRKSSAILFLGRMADPTRGS
jgi:serpin B